MLLIFMVAAAVATASPAPVCVRPNLPAAVLHAQEPDLPPMALQQGISGTVQVVATLDEQSHLTHVALRSSPSALLNYAALDAARHTAFRTAIRDCRLVASEFVYSVDFPKEEDSGLPPFPYVSGTSPPLIVAHDSAQIALPVNAIVLRVKFSALGTSVSAAAAADDAAYATFRAKLAAFPALAPPSDEYYNVFPADAPQVGFLASHGIVMTISRDTPLRDLLRAADGSGATSATIAYLVNTGGTELAPAVAVALRTAENDARSLAEHRGLRLGALVDSKSRFRVPEPATVLLGVPLARGELPALPRTVNVVVDVAARFAIQP